MFAYHRNSRRQRGDRDRQARPGRPSETGSRPTTDSIVARLYDKAGRITRESQKIGSGATTRNVGYTYDVAGRVSRLMYPGGSYGFWYHYGEDGRVSLIDKPWLNQFAVYTYVGRRMTRRRVVDSYDTHYDYDGLARLTQLYSQTSSVTYDHYAYGLDKADSRTYRENKVTSGKDELYSYDTLDRLTRSERGNLNEGYSAIDDLTRFQGYRLDQVGNWTRFYDDSAAAQTRFHNAVNEITKIDDSAVNVGHDAAGNMTRAPFGGSYHSYEYDHLNRLTLVKDDGDDEVGKYQYDALGRRIEKIDVANSVTKQFYYGQTPSDGSSWQLLNTYKNGTWYEGYLWGTTYVDELLRRDRDTDGNGYWDRRLIPVQDGNWNVTAVIYCSAAVERYAYDPYGRVSVLDADWSADDDGQSDHDWPILYGGYYYDSETHLHHVRHRYLQPTLGRWMSRDPIGYVDGMNLYQYASSQPTAFVDPGGLAKADIIYIDYLVKKYGLSKAGRRALHDALKALKGARGVASHAVAEAEARSIAALGGKFVLRSFSILLIILTLDSELGADDTVGPPTPEEIARRIAERERAQARRRECVTCVCKRIRHKYITRPVVEYRTRSAWFGLKKWKERGATYWIPDPTSESKTVQETKTFKDITRERCYQAKVGEPLPLPPERSEEELRKRGLIPRPGHCPSDAEGNQYIDSQWWECRPEGEW